MEFWGVEVKPNESLVVEVKDFKLLHISQVALGEVKNGKKVENIPVKININEKKFVVGTLSSERAPQIIFDLVFEQDLELSHGWKDGSVYFCGYIADNPIDDEYPLFIFYILFY
ncbi:putative histone deacetylase [Helianthus annuus]|uniref:Histone deacetylase n=1 Tax=Helianthus annuus TaxID=4232 RepID=A0A251VHY4_HELAN|nr:putative histone deacetylase [Helianthus annuus]